MKFFNQNVFAITLGLSLAAMSSAQDLAAPSGERTRTGETSCIAGEIGSGNYFNYNSNVPRVITNVVLSASVQIETAAGVVALYEMPWGEESEISALKKASFSESLLFLGDDDGVRNTGTVHGTIPLAVDVNGDGDLSDEEKANPQGVHHVVSIQYDLDTGAGKAQVVTPSGFRKQYDVECTW